MRRLFILNILVLISSFSAFAKQDERVARVFAGETLVNSTYTSFCMDSFGFMWIGTDNGLLRFDGNHYTEYRHIEGNLETISDNRILGLVKDNKERIWVATANGLNVYDFTKDSFKRIDIPNFGEKGYIISIVADKYGKITFVVAGVGIYEIEDIDCDRRSTKCLSSIESLKDVNTLLAHSNESLYAGTKNGNVYQYTNNNEWRKVTEVGSPVFDMSEEQNGAILINSTNGLFRFHSLSKKLNRIQLDSQIVVNNLSDSFGGWIYLATYGQGLWKIHYDSNEAEYCSDIYSPFINLEDSRIGAVFGSKDGSLWIGADYEGVLIVPPAGNSFKYRKISNIIKDFDVPLTAMKVWKGKSIIGNVIGEVAILSPEGEALKVIKVPGGKAISSIELIDDDKAVLGVLDNSVWQLDLNNGEINKLLELPGKYLSLMVCEGMDGCLYIGAYSKGLLKFDPRTGEKVWISPDKNGKKLLSPFITLLEAYDDKIWIGAFGGLACYNIATGKFEDIDQTPFMACAVYDIETENRDIFLVATTNGLLRYYLSTKEIQKYTTLDGLSDNDVRSIAIDGEGGKWIGTMLGLSYQAPGDNRFVSFAGGNGIAERSFEGLDYDAHSDRMFARNRMGLTIFSPKDIILPVFQDSLKVSDIYVKGKRLNPKDSSGYPDVINLSYDDNSIAVRISTMDFRDVTNMTFLWRFAGESEWKAFAEGADLINLSSLPPGTYNLEYKAIEAGVESPVSSIKIRVAHPWYLSWIAKTIYIVIFLVLVWMVLIIIRKRHKERLNAKKMEFFMDMSHDMRSPLTLILSPLESLLKENLSSGMREKVRGAYRNAHRILNTVNQLLDIKKFDYGNRKLQCRKTRINEFIGEIVEMYLSQAEDKGITLTIDSSNDLNEVWSDRAVLDRIISNLISYALKYTPENGIIEVRIKESKDTLLGDCVEIRVVDYGIGFENSKEGYGLGVDICRRYAKLHHGEVRVETRKDGIEGSEYKVLLPLIESAYKSDELLVEETETPLEESIHIKEDDKDPEEKSNVDTEDIIPAPVIVTNLKGNDEALLERVNKVLEERIDEEDMNVDLLAEAVGVSRTHLYRRMKERLGISPSDYIRNIRLKKACELLKNNDLDITQIAYALGFSSQSQFSTSFKRVRGLTPSEYRNKHKNDNNSDQEFK